MLLNTQQETVQVCPFYYYTFNSSFLEATFQDVPENPEKPWNPGAVRIETFIFGGKFISLIESILKSAP